MPSPNSTNINPKAVFGEMVGEFFSNTFFFGVGCAVIVLIAIYLSWWFAFVLFVGFTLVVIVSVIHQIALLAINFVYLYSHLTGKMSGHPVSDYLYLSGANLMELLELGVLIIFNLAIYHTLYP